MTAQSDPYVRVYYRISTDDKFRAIYRDDALLGCWLKLLIIADAMHPAPAHLPFGVDLARVDALADAGLIDIVQEGMYVIHGLASERTRRSDTARDSAAKRWHKPDDATAMRPHSDSIATAYGVGMRPHSDRNATAMRPHTGSDATAMLSDPIRSDPILSAPSSAIARAHETERYGLPHLTDEVVREAETVTGRSITTLHGTWAGELDRLVEDRGPEAVRSAMQRAASAIGSRPSWPQLVAGVRNLLEPLPSSAKGAPMVDDPVDDFVRRFREGKVKL